MWALLLVSLIFPSLGSLTKRGVPVLLWAPNRAPTIHPSVSALQQVPYPTFQADFVNSFNSDKIILFLQDELSVEDLTNHAKQLKSLSKWVQTSQSVYLPSVENPSFIMHDLPTHGYEVQTLEPGSEQAGIKLKNQTKTLIVVKLPPTATNPSRKNSLQKADEVIESVLQKIGGLTDFVALFTAQRSSTIMHEYRLEHSRVKREVQMPGIHRSACVLLHLKQNIVLNVTDAINKTTIALTNGNYEAQCVGNAKSPQIGLKITYSQIGGYHKQHVVLNFGRNGSRWQMKGGSLGWYDITTDKLVDIPLRLVTRLGSIPLGKSYVCGSDVVFRSGKSTTNKYELLIRGMQVQAFIEKGANFGQPWECVGFFTAPILAGWITTFILGSVLVLGLSMILGLKTSDRFDDPKTAHVFVTNTAD